MEEGVRAVGYGLEVGPGPSDPTLGTEATEA
jgi:hypothetical protein